MFTRRRERQELPEHGAQRERISARETALLVYVALRLILPILAVIIGVVVIAWGALTLLFP